MGRYMYTRAMGCFVDVIRGYKRYEKKGERGKGERGKGGKK